MNAAIGALVGSQALRGLVNYSDTWTQVESSLKLVTSSTADLVVTQQALFKVSQDSRQSYEATASLYSRMARSSRDLGTSQEDLLKITSTVNKALVVSGASASESASAVTQLGQAMASGVLRGDEFNSIAENGSRITQALAESLGVSIGELREMASQGKLTSEVLTNSLLDSAEKINDEFGKMGLTIGQALQSFDDNIGKILDRANKGTGIMANLATSIGWVGEALAEADEYWFGDKNTDRIYKEIAAQEKFNQVQRIAQGLIKDSIPDKKASKELIAETAEFLGVTTKSLEGLTEQEVKFASASKVSNDSIEKGNRLAQEAENADMAYYEAQSLLNDEVEENTQLTIENNAVKEQAIIATEELAKATSWLHDEQGNLRDSPEGQSYDVYSGYGGSEFQSFIPASGVGSILMAGAEAMAARASQTTASTSTPSNNPTYKATVDLTDALDDLKETLNKQQTDLNDYTKSIGDYADSLSSVLTSISDSLGTDYYGSARASLFGGTSSALSFNEAKANASEAWKLFKTDTFNEDYLDTYNKRMDELIGTLDEFKDSSNYNSSQEQEFAKHLALRQVEGYQDAQLDTKEEVDNQLIYLEAIKNATQGTEKETAASLLVQNTIKDIDGDLKIIQSATRDYVNSVKASNNAINTTTQNSDEKLGSINSSNDAIKSISNTSDNRLSNIYAITNSSGQTLSSIESINTVIEGYESDIKSTNAAIAATESIISDNTKATEEAVSDNLDKTSKQGKVSGVITTYQGYSDAFTGEWRDTGSTTEYSYFKSGGYTGNYGVNEEAGIVHGQEMVLNASTTSQMGINDSSATGVFGVMASQITELVKLNFELVKTNKRMLNIQTDSRNILLEA